MLYESEEEKQKRFLEEEKRTQDRLDLVRAYKEVFKSGAGRKVLRDLMRQCFFDKPTYDSAPNEIAMHIREGRRSVVLDILDVLEISEENIIKVLHNRFEDDEEEEF